jgi:hypothetical protein
MRVIAACGDVRLVTRSVRESVYSDVTHGGGQLRSAIVEWLLADPTPADADIGPRFTPFAHIDR